MLLVFLILLVRRRDSINKHNNVPVFYKITQEQNRSATEYLLHHQTSSMKELHAAVKARFLKTVSRRVTIKREALGCMRKTHAFKIFDFNSEALDCNPSAYHDCSPRGTMIT